MEEIKCLSTDIKVTYWKDDGSVGEFVADYIELGQYAEREYIENNVAVDCAAQQWCADHGHQMSLGQALQVYTACLHAWNEFKKKLPDSLRSLLDTDSTQASSTDSLTRYWRERCQEFKQKTSSDGEPGSPPLTTNEGNVSSSKPVGTSG